MRSCDACADDVCTCCCSGVREEGSCGRSRVMVLNFHWKSCRKVYVRSHGGCRGVDGVDQTVSELLRCPAREVCGG